MRCLRCGREIGDSVECPCGHFYESNVSSEGIFRKNRLRKEARIKYSIRIISYIVVVLLFIPIMYIIYKTIDLDVNGDNSGALMKKYGEYCALRCESDDFSIENGYCICTPDKKYPLE